MKRAFSLARAYQLLEPGPVVLVTTVHKGRPNIMTLSWHTMMDFEPPLVGCVMSSRNFSLNALKATKECAINIPTIRLAKQVVRCGNRSGRKIDKFKVFRLTPVAPSRIGAPLIAECFASLECRVVDGSMASKYNFFVLEVLQAWIDPAEKNPRTLHHRGHGVFAVDGRIIKLPSRMK